LLLLLWPLAVKKKKPLHLLLQRLLPLQRLLLKPLLPLQLHLLPKLLLLLLLLQLQKPLRSNSHGLDGLTCSGSQQKTPQFTLAGFFFDCS
jgi:hypothetical protein